MPQVAAPSRRFTVANLMILVVVAAVGLAQLRPYFAALPQPDSPYASATFRTIEATYGAWSFVAIGWMMTLLILQYRGPHPRRGRLARRPGLVACWAAVAALVVGGVHEMTRHAFQDQAGVLYAFHESWITLSVRTGPTVAGAWLVLALSGRWRSDPGWIDRLGRLLGGCWIAWMLLWLLPDPVRSKIPPFWDWVFA